MNTPQKCLFISSAGRHQVLFDRVFIAPDHAGAAAADFFKPRVGDFDLQCQPEAGRFGFFEQDRFGIQAPRHGRAFVARRFDRRGRFRFFVFDRFGEGRFQSFGPSRFFLDRRGDHLQALDDRLGRAFQQQRTVFRSRGFDFRASAFEAALDRDRLGQLRQHRPVLEVAAQRAAVRDAREAVCDSRVVERAVFVLLPRVVRVFVPRQRAARAGRAHDQRRQHANHEVAHPYMSHLSITPFACVVVVDRRDAPLQESP